VQAKCSFGKGFPIRPTVELIYALPRRGGKSGVSERSLGGLDKKKCLLLSIAVYSSAN
jgi:hypothetical protein